MSYHVTDNNVNTYIQQLKGLVYTFNQQTELGTQNLKIILQNIQTNIEQLRYQTSENLDFAYVRLNRLNLLIADANNKTQFNDNIDLRYCGYKQHALAITVFSGFMELTNLVVDSCLSAEISNHSQLTREYKELLLLIKNLEAQLTAITEFMSQLPQLISKCST